MEAFFNTAELLSTRAKSSILPKCGECGLYKTCKSPYMPYSGKGEKKILLVGEAPGRNEDEQGLQFVGDAGKVLEESLDEAGIDLRRDCWVTNSLICRPPKNREPTKQEIVYCLPNLAKTIQETKPDVIIPLGKYAMSSILHLTWQPDNGAIFRWVGRCIPAQKYNAWICPTYHPSSLLYNDSPLLKNLFQRHIKNAAEIEGKPWKTIPDYARKVNFVYNDELAAEDILCYARDDRLVTFDYETNMIKPDSTSAAIYSCSISNGETTISFPWRGRVIQAMKEFLKSPVPKSAHNEKFERRWSRAILGVDPNNLIWCSMIVNHCLDGREQTSGLDVVSYNLLGVPAWDSSVAKYLKSKEGSGNSLNNIHLCPLNDLLLYGGIDALLEHKVTKIQMKQLGISI